MPQSENSFQKQFLILIILAWTIPPVFGMSFLLFIELFTPAQMSHILLSPLMNLFILSTVLYAFFYFRNFSRPLVAYLNQPDDIHRDRATRRIRQFPLHFWINFLLYLLIAPAATIIAAEISSDFVARPIDWFRIHLVALIVSIIVGLPIFFAVFDLFGKVFGNINLHRPILTLRIKVFMIGALIPLLIDTMLVQYYWTRTGFFSLETFFVWLLLELFAIIGSLLFVRSIGQSLSPLATFFGQLAANKISTKTEIIPQSTDEFGVLATQLDDLLDKQLLHNERLAFSNLLLHEVQTRKGKENLLKVIVDKTCEIMRGDTCFLSLYDRGSNKLIGVIHSGVEYSEQGYYQLDLDETSMTTAIFNSGKTIVIDDLRNDPRANPKMIELFSLYASAGAPLIVAGQPIGVLQSARTDKPHHYSRQEVRIIEAFAQEAAIVHSMFEDQDLKKKTESAIRQILEGISSTIGEQFFHAIAENMSQILAADVITIGIIDRNNDRIIHSLALNIDGKPVPNVSYTLPGTPCEKIINDARGYHFTDIQNLFPDDEELLEFEAIDYIGIPLLDSNDKLIGIQSAMFRHKISNPEYIESILGIFAARTSAEIERIRNEERIKHMAYYDSLTGLPNRELLLDRLNQALAHAQRSNSCVAVMLLDLDHFKSINDSLGHPIGDQLLSEVSSRLKQAVRSEDTVARLGGDEFVILLSDLGSPENALKHTTFVADKIREELAPIYLLEGHQLAVTPSIGIALYPEDGVSGDVLIKHADTALYQAKGQGRNNYQFFSQAMNTAAVERLKLETALRTALQEEQFSLVFQPKVAIASGRITGAEILLRWNHPEFGQISPTQFIPVAEETGMIIPIGKWVMEQACKHTTELWCARKRCTRLQSLSFNVSPKQFRQTDFILQLEDAIKKFSTKPSCIELEVTENVLIDDFQNVEEKLQRLIALGVQISIDDFGTGYSSLRYLQKLPIHTIKIDRTFIHNIASSKGDAVIVETILAMANHLKLRTIAEGVETREQLEILRSMGCQDYQGYYYSKPVELDVFRQMMLREPAEA